MRSLLALLGILLLVFVTACSSSDRDDSVAAATPEPTAIPTPDATPTPEPPGELDWEDVVELMEPSTVMIRADFPTTAVSIEGQGSGTGIVYSEDGYIITNAHVVSGAAALTVSNSGSPRQRSARFIGISPCDDLAVIQVTDMDGLSVANLGNTGDVRAGGEVATLGYPLGDMLSLDISFSRGVIGQMNHTMGHYERLIQHDATINPGNSGGPLVNRIGDVIGVNTLYLDPAFGGGMYWSIDINQAMPIVDQLEQGNNRLWHGMNLVPNLYPDYFGVEGGLVVAAVASGSSASSIGVQPAFLLTHLEGLSIESMDDVCRVLRSQSEGSSVSVEFMNVTELGYEFFEGEVVLGGSGGQDLQLVWYEAFTDGSIDDDEQDDQSEASAGDTEVGFNTDVDYQPAEYAGTATIDIWEFGPCGDGGEWIETLHVTEQVDVRVLLDYPYETMNSRIWFTMFSEEEYPSGFWIRTAWLYDEIGLVEYWDAEFDGVELSGVLIDEPIGPEETGNLLYDLAVPDPCDVDSLDVDSFQPTEFVMMAEETFIDGGFFGGLGVLEIWGMTADLSRDFEISINVNRVDD